MPKRILLTADEGNTVGLLAQRIKLARLRRNLSQAEMAERAGMGRLAYIEIEKGNSGASIAALVKVLAVLGYPDRLATLLESDPLGEDLEAVHGRKRAGGRRDVEDF